MDKLAFEALVRQNGESFYRISVSILRNAADAEDAVQQALMKGWASRSKMHPGKERAWLTRIVINECRNIQRQRMRLIPMEILPKETPAPAQDGEVRKAVLMLPENLRLPLLLKYMEGMTEEEAAKALRISKTALKGRLFRARKALEKQLKEEVELE